MNEIIDKNLIELVLLILLIPLAGCKTLKFGKKLKEYALENKSISKQKKLLENIWKKN